MVQSVGLSPISRPEPEITVCEDIIRSIRDQLQSGALRPGDRLPSERDMAERLGIGRNTLREAERTLTLMGVLEKRGAAGTRVATSGENVLDEPFRFLMLLDGAGFEDLSEARELIEVHLAGRAAERRTDADLVAIERTLHPGILDGDPANTLSSPQRNRMFHQAVAAAAHNPIMERLVCALIDVRRAFVDALCPDRCGWTNINLVHERIYRAIKNGDSRGARRAMDMDMELANDFWEYTQTIAGRQEGKSRS